MKEQLQRIRQYLETTNHQERGNLAAELLKMSEKLEQEEHEAYYNWKVCKTSRKAKERYIYANARLCLFSEILQVLEGEPIPF